MSSARDQQSADAIRRGVEHNQRSGNVRGQFHTIGGRHCIDGSFRELGVPRRVRERIGAATARHTGATHPVTGVPYDHVAVNDTARHPAEMRRTMLAVADSLDGGRKPGQGVRPQARTKDDKPKDTRTARQHPRPALSGSGVRTAGATVGVLASLPVAGGAAAAFATLWAVVTTVLTLALFVALGAMVAAPVAMLVWEADPRRSIPAWVARTTALGRARREQREQAMAAVEAARAPIVLDAPDRSTS